jgi:hypothetical protein
VSTGFAAPAVSWDQWSVVTLRAATLPFFVAASLLVAGCVTSKPQAVAAVAPGMTAREQELEDRKEQLLQQLATCESGSWGPSARPIYGSRGAYHGRFQFTLRTFITYTRMRDGTVLTMQEAAEYTQNYEKAASLAWYMIHDLHEPWHWPLCSRKLGIPAQLKVIKAI